MNRKILIVGLVGLSLALACNRDDSRTPGSRFRGGMPRGGFPGDMSMTAVPVSVDTVRIKPISAYVTATTTLEAERDVEVVSRVTGVVKEIFLEEGEWVNAGQALAQLDDESTRIQVQEAKARAENAVNAYKRAKDLFEQNLIAGEEYENAKYQMEIMKAQLAAARLNLKYTTIKAPIPGVVAERFIDPGDHVTVNQVVYRIADRNPILARVRIPEKEVRRIKLGQRARISVEAVPDRVFEGRVDMISPVVDPQTGTVKVTVGVDNRAGLLAPGMFATVKIVIDTHERALVIPKKALLLEGDIDHVYLFRDGKAVNRRVKVGYETSGEVEVLEGLEPGDLVITVGAEGLRDGMAVYVPGMSEEPLAAGPPPREPAGAVPGFKDGSRNPGIPPVPPGEPGKPSVKSPPAAGRPGANRPPGPAPAGGLDGMKFDRERWKKFEAILLSDPEIKKAYQERLKRDPSLASDMKKKRAFLQEILRRRGGWQR